MRRKRSVRDESRREVEDELAFHLEERAAEYRAAGMDAETARQAALSRLGDLGRVQGECTDLLVSERRALARRNWLSDLRQDLRFAGRAARRAPVFTGTAVLTLALGIGANAAIFGVVKSVLLDGLPYAEPDRLARVQATFESQPDKDSGLSAGTVTDVLRRQRSFERMAATSSGGPDAILEEPEPAASVRLAWIQPDYFATLGVAPVVGRAFTAEEAEPDTAQVVIVSYALWRQRFGGAPDVVGRTLRLNGIRRTIVGVLPDGYVHPTGVADVLMPFRLEPLMRDPVSARGAHFLELVGRLRPGVPMARANADVAAVGEELVAEYPRENRGIRLRASPLRTTMEGDTRAPLLILLGAAGLVLLMACANIASALLSRMITRRREFAIRVSLGAPRGRLVRQLLAESLLLSLAGGTAGLALAVTGLRVLRDAHLPALPQYADLTLDAGAIAFSFLITLATAAIFGLLPALAAGREDPQAALREESRGSSGGRGAGRMRGALVAAQVALCLTLLAGAGLLTRSMWRMASAPIGFTTEDALTFDIPLRGARYRTTEAQTLLRDGLLEDITALPGVLSAVTTSFLPTRVFNSNGVLVVGAERAPGEATPFVMTNGVSEEYFRVLDIPVLAGRTFTRFDGPDTPPVVVISEAMARQFWPQGDALGARIVVGPDPESTPLEVVGIVGDVRSSLIPPESKPLMYMSQRQGWFGATFIIRTEGDPATYVEAVRRVLAARDPALPLANVGTLSGMLAKDLAPRRLPTLLLVSFAMLALLLACMGIYALFTSMAMARAREFGVRMALGSSRRDVARLVLRDGFVWMGLGMALGAIGIVAMTRALRSIVYGIAPLDAWSIAGAVFTLLLAAAIALLVPVRRATRADPLAILREA